LCKQAKSATTLPSGLLQPLPIPNQIWEDFGYGFYNLSASPTWLHNNHGGNQ